MRDVTSSRAGWLVGLLLLLVTSLPASAQPEDLSAWVELPPESLRGWRVEASAERIRIAHERPPTPREQVREVLVLLTVAQSSLNWILEGMLPVLRDGRVRVELTLYKLGTGRQEQERMLALADSGQFDLVIALGSDATRFLYNRFGNQPTPVVALCKAPELWLGFEEGASQQAKPGNMAFVSLSLSPDVQLHYLQELLGPLKVLTVVYDRRNQSTVEVEAEAMRRLAARDGFQLLELAVDGKRSAEAMLSEQVPRMARAMRLIDPEGRHSLFWVTTSSAVYDELERIDGLSEGIPVLGSVREAVREGSVSAVMSIGVPFKSAGQLGARYVLEVLGSRLPPSRLPMGVISPPDLAIHLRRARQLDVKLPFHFLEQASSIYDLDGRLVRQDGQPAVAPPP
ncbi:ABC transporter substrate-binding protein [Corallococcus exercitus]|uniref:ABC transporter substrate-binding protein n=1 Tax=Corallococcus exercitus TaxID=2316736 RepID=UPI0035D4C150